MRISDEKIDEIRNAIDIVELIGSVVQLKRRGKNYIGLCPFHNEKTPSFTVSHDRQMFHCFGCGAGGNAITFTMQNEKVSFPEALRLLAQRAGINLPSYDSEQAEEEAGETEALYNVMRISGLFFYHCLTNSPEGRAALEYFHKRGFSDETIRKFGLGYSLQSWDGLYQHLHSQGVSPELMEKAGLVRNRKTDEAQNFYDYFRGRAMFPIFSPTGRVIAFGARKLREDDPLAKYINSPETPLYNKSRVLYGLFHAREAIRREESAFLVEGYADLISLFQAGIQNTVASSGTALTPEQIQLLGRYTKKVILLYDADSAGVQAMIRGVDLVIEGGLDVLVVELPEGEDPDTYIRKFGIVEFKKLAAGAVSFIEFKARMFERRNKLSTPEGQTEAARSIVQTISKVQDELKRNFMIKEVAERYGLYESVLYRELEKYKSASGRKTSSKMPAKGQSQIAMNREGEAGANSSSPVNSLGKKTPMTVAERDLVKLLLEEPSSMVEFIFSNINIDEIMNPQAKSICEIILQRYEKGEKIDPHLMLESDMPEELKQLITDVIVSRYELSEKGQIENPVLEPDPFLIADGALRMLKKNMIDAAIDNNQRLMKEAAHRGDDVGSFLDHHKQLLEQRKFIETLSFLPQTDSTESLEQET